VTLVDASALLAFLQGESGSDRVEAALLGDSGCTAVNWSEVAQKVKAAGGNWNLARALLLGYGLRVEPVTGEDAEAAAALWRRGSGLSLADRFCLAFAERSGAEVLTADLTWGEGPGIVQIR